MNVSQENKQAENLPESRAERIRAALVSVLAPSRLDVRDDSAQHAGHVGARPGGQTHFHVAIASPALAGVSRVEAHRRIHAPLVGEFAAGLHALSIEILKP